MRRILLALAITLAASVYCSAQTAAPSVDGQTTRVAKKPKKAKDQAAADAQSTTTSSSSTATGLKKDGTPDMRLEANRTRAAQTPASAATTAPAPAAPSAQATGLKKDGTPDMRLKANRTKAVQASAASTIQTSSTPQPAPAPKSAVTLAPAAKVQGNAGTPDPVVATDAKGRAIYQGKRGGKYYINKNGNKEYVKHTQ